jgi:CHAT domain-containing protein/predicted negative regulator of RcsB-dependent stress response
MGIFWCILSLLNTFCAGQTNSPASKELQDKVRMLGVGHPVEARLARGQKHVYGLLLSDTDFVRFTISAEKPASNLQAVIIDPEGEQIEELSGPVCPFSLYYIPTLSDLYSVRLELLHDDNSPPGTDNSLPPETYKIQIDELREATNEDKIRVSASQALIQAYRQSFRSSPAPENQSAEKYEEAISLFRAVGDPRGEAQAFQVLSLRSFVARDYQATVNYLKQARPLWQRLGESEMEARALESMANSLGRLGQTQEALNSVDEALRLRRALGDRSGEARLLLARGDIYDAMGEFQLALNDKEQALSISRDTKGRMVDGYYALTDLGHIYDELGEPQNALAYYDQALNLARAHRERGLEFTLLSIIGDAYAEAGDKHKAFEYYNKSLILARGDRDDEMWAVRRLGEFYVAQGEHAKALRCFDQVLPYFHAQHKTVVEALSLYRAGIAYHNLGQWQRALDALNQALSIWPFKNRTRRKILQEIGSVYQDSGDSQKALYYYDKSLTESRATNDLQGEALALCGIAHAERVLQRVESAQRNIEEGLKIFESARGQIAGAESRSSYFAAVQNEYEFYIDLLMQMNVQRPDQNFDAAAFQASERARARSLLDMLVESHLDIHQGADLKLLERERVLQQRLRARSQYQVELLSGPHAPEQADAVARELQGLTAEYEETEAQIRTTSPSYAALSQPVPLDLRQIQRQVLDADTLLLEYALGEERSYVWCVTTSSLASFTLPKRAEIEQAARRVHELLTARNTYLKGEAEPHKEARIKRARAQYPAAAARLSEMILGPVVSLFDHKRLLIVADGALQYLPFAALPLTRQKARGSQPGEPLMIESEIVTAPSASIVAVLRRELAGRKSAPKAVAVLADPVFDMQDSRVSMRSQVSDTRYTDRLDAKHQDLPRDLQRSWEEVESGRRDWKIPRLVFSRQEADAIVNTSPRGSSLEAIDFQANRTTATSPELAQFRVVHFATHSMIDSRTPALSGIVLSLVDRRGNPQDGFLRLWDIYNLHLPVDLVVLSGCQTALGKRINGEGLIGLTRGFMYAGAARVMASLWAVDDAATAEFMSQFYQAMLKRDLPPAAALRAAQIYMWKQKRWQGDPYFWAAFQLQGEWK